MLTRARARDRGELNLAQFFAVNRFLFDVLVGDEHVTQKVICDSLHLSVFYLNGRLRSLGLPTSARQLRKLAVSAQEMVRNLAAPPVYVALRSPCRGDRLSLQFVEFCIPFTPFHFDFDGLLREAIDWKYDQKFVSFLQRPIASSTSFTTDDTDEQSFRSRLASWVPQFPDFFRDLSNDDRFVFNNKLSICFLYGQVTFPTGGIASPHLQGTFSLLSRKSDTGYFLLDQISVAPTAEPEQKLHRLFQWLKDNNPLYADIEHPVDFSVFSIVAGNSNDVIGTVVNPFVRDHYLRNDSPFDRDLRVPVRFKKSDDEVATARVPLELALGYTFPLLFPFGPPPTIPGKTFREKATNILFAHEFYRCGRLQCNLILWFYHLIEESELFYYTNHITLQNVRMPEGSSRSVPNQGKPNDPAFAAYWKSKQAQVRGMANLFGPPDLMVTFTFSNRWPDCVSFIGQTQLTFDMGNDMRFCPVDTMRIWDRHFSRSSERAFRTLCSNLQLGEATHYMWRLEFQARGAPHAHALIWLSHPLSLESVARSMFGSTPSLSAPVLRDHVLTHMVHTCTLERCKRGIPTASCRYGFPKPESRNVHYDDRGILCLPRSRSDGNIVEYNPIFLLHWDGHCHMHILRTKEQSDVSDRALSYILKYNFKAEPDLSVRIGQDDRRHYESLFQARVLSAEEAAARVLGMTFCAADVECSYYSFHPSDSQLTLFRDGVQIQMPKLEQYFHRPPELESMRVLAFFSYYELDATKMSNRDLCTALLEQGRTVEVPIRHRPPKTLALGSTWEKENLRPFEMIDRAYLFPYEPLPAARAMECRLRFRPKIVITEKFTANTYSSESFCFLLLLLSGCWRSEDEMRADCPTWRDALTYHGITTQESPEELQIQLLSYMITSQRYSPDDIVRISADFKFDVLSSMLGLQGTLPETFHQAILRSASAIRDFQSHQSCLTAEVTDVEGVTDEMINHFVRYRFSPAEIEESANWIRDKVVSLNRDQMVVYSALCSRIGPGQCLQTNCFVMGKAGTGKSFLISSLRHYLTANQIPHVVCASTGIAAMLIGGRTAHSVFNLFTDANDKAFCHLHLNRPNGVAVSKVAVVIIDEVTMLPAKCFDALDRGLRLLMAEASSPDRDKPFGGKSLLLFGDLGQVPAVVKSRDDFTVFAGQFMSASNFDQFLHFELTVSMRARQDDELFLQVLSDVRDSFDGKLTQRTVDALKSRFLPHSDTCFANVIGFLDFGHRLSMCVAFRNERCHDFNSIMLANLTRGAPPVVCKGRFYVRTSRAFMSRPNADIEEENARQRDTVTERPARHYEIDHFRRAVASGKSSCLVPIDLYIAVGARVMLLKNISPEDRLINGATGTVDQIERDAAGEVVIISVRFFHLSRSVPISRCNCHTLFLPRGDKIQLFQFPLMLAWATTAHKSQGQTLDRVAINIADSAFAHGSFYVALSRVRRLDDILLFGLPEWPPEGPDFHVNAFIRDEMSRIGAELPF